MSYDFEEAEDLTVGPYDLPVTPGIIENASFEFSNDILGDLSTATIKFTPATTFLTEYGNF